jgi:hypothetical protein
MQLSPLTEEEAEAFLLEPGGEVTHLRRASTDPLARHIYAALNCREFDGGVSGRGLDERAFSREELKAALVYLCQREGEGLEVEREITFVKECLSWLSQGVEGKVVMEFW